MRAKYNLEYNEDPVDFEYLLMIVKGKNNIKKLFHARKESLYSNNYNSIKFESCRPNIWQHIHNRLEAGGLISHEKIPLYNGTIYSVNWINIGRRFISMLLEHQLNLSIKSHLFAFENEKNISDYEQEHYKFLIENKLVESQVLIDLKQTKNKIVESEKQFLINSLKLPEFIKDKETKDKFIDKLATNPILKDVFVGYFNFLYSSKSYYSMSFNAALKNICNEIHTLNVWNIYGSLINSDIKPNKNPLLAKLRQKYDRQIIREFELIIRLGVSSERSIIGYALESTL
ncbi:MAG: hypothetical protein KKF44_02300 [Nanoarchaeota archaeon]|nr:hypothetical protein [Nanoarchaeota archaeon]